MDQLVISNRKAWVKFAPYLLIVITALPILLTRLDIFPHPWLDEGHSSHSARVLVERGFYGTYMSGRNLPFDPGISTGPTVILPLAISYSLLGPSIVIGRLVIVVFALAGLIVLYKMAQYLYGVHAGLVSTMLVIGFPAIDQVSYLMLGRQILGEIPGITLIMLGVYILFKNWNQSGWIQKIIAGIAIGLGIIAKTQLAIGIIPSIFLITLARTLDRRLASVFQALFVLIIAVGLAATWVVIQRIGTPEALRIEYSLTLAKAGEVHFLAPNFGRFLNRYGLIMVGIAGLASIITLWRLLVSYRQTRSFTNPQCAELTFVLSIVISTVWFVILSVGWPRYMIFSLLMSLVLLGKFFWDLANHFVELRPAFLVLGTTILIASFALGSNLTYILRSSDDSGVTEMATFINENVQSDAVIESWAWEIDPLTSHWEYHHPHQLDLYTAIQQQFHLRAPFNIDYDIFQANPDYLLTNQLSNWVHIYDSSVAKANFKPVASFGQYSLYERKRTITTLYR